MKVAIVSASSLTKHNRWDAQFHLLNTEYASKAEQLSRTMREEDVVTLLSDEQAVPPQALQLVAPLARGNGKPDRGQLLKAINEYPYLALAIIQDKGVAVIREKRAELKRQLNKMLKAEKSLNAMGAPFTGILPITPKLQRQLDSNRFVAGAVYSDGETLSIPVHTEEDAYVVDCWVIQTEDWTGPQMLDSLVSGGELPMPRRYEDLGNPVGFVNFPDHTVNYGIGRWL